MASYTDSKNQSISLIKIIASSGEGVVWTTNRHGFLAKIYHKVTSEKISKLQAMIAAPPNNPTAAQNHISLAWPQDLLKDSKGNYAGFLMPEVKNARQLIQVYNPQLRNIDASNFNWLVLHITAQNLAKAIEAIHARNYVIGDMKPQNILVDPGGLVAIIDTDSFQITDSKTSKVYRCPVGSEGFTPPELIGKDMSSMTQTRYHDRFRLAVVIYHLLFGYHPFSGKWNGIGQPPGQDESVSKGYWPYSQNNQLTLSNIQISLDILHPEIKKCFLECFNNGHQSPTKRPSAKDWVKALERAIPELTVCGKVNNHIYSKHTRKCCWCDRSNSLSCDIFPAVKNPVVPSSVTQRPISPPFIPAPQPAPAPKPVTVKPAPAPKTIPLAYPAPTPKPVPMNQPVPVQKDPVWGAWIVLAVPAVLFSVIGWQGNWIGIQDKICPILPEPIQNNCSFGRK